MHSNKKKEIIVGIMKDNAYNKRLQNQFLGPLTVEWVNILVSMFWS